MTDTNEDEVTGVRKAIIEECNAIMEHLLAKNKAYGNSALNPVRIFSKASTLEQINVRLDLIGYLVLYRIQVKSMESSD